MCFQAGRAEAAKKALEKMKSEGEMIEKPFIQKKRMYRFPQSEKSGRVVARVENMVRSAKQIPSFLTQKKKMTPGSVGGRWRNTPGGRDGRGELAPSAAIGEKKELDFVRDWLSPFQSWVQYLYFVSHTMRRFSHEALRDLQTPGRV
jgi:hypothetical protein